MAIKPYKGSEPYIFISYAHKNMTEALEIIDFLQQSGYRVWFDEGIDPGTPWDDNIAMRIDHCGCFVALISAEYLNSDNCQDEMNYARDQKKDNRLLIYLRNVQLPGGMAMRYNRTQAIFKHKYADTSLFFDKILETPILQRCLETAPTLLNAKKSDHNDILTQYAGKSTAVYESTGTPEQLIWKLSESSFPVHAQLVVERGTIAFCNANGAELGPGKYQLSKVLKNTSASGIYSVFEKLKNSIQAKETALTSDIYFVRENIDSIMKWGSIKSPVFQGADGNTQYEVFGHGDLRIKVINAKHFLDYTGYREHTSDTLIGNGIDSLLRALVRETMLNVFFDTCVTIIPKNGWAIESLGNHLSSMSKALEEAANVAFEKYGLQTTHFTLCAFNSRPPL